MSLVVFPGGQSVVTDLSEEYSSSAVPELAAMGCANPQRLAKAESWYDPVAGGQYVELDEQGDHSAGRD